MNNLPPKKTHPPTAQPVQPAWSSLVSSCSRLIREALVNAGHAPGSATFRVLGMLSRHDGLHVGEIAKGENATQATASNLVARLKREGLVETQADPRDRRATLVKITSDGEHVIKDLFRSLDDSMEELTANLTEQEVQTLFQALPVINKIIQGGLK